MFLKKNIFVPEKPGGENEGWIRRPITFIPVWHGKTLDLGN